MRKLIDVTLRLVVEVDPLLDDEDFNDAIREADYDIDFGTFGEVVDVSETEVTEWTEIECE